MSMSMSMSTGVGCLKVVTRDGILSGRSVVIFRNEWPECAPSWLSQRTESGKERLGKLTSCLVTYLHTWASLINQV